MKDSSNNHYGEINSVAVIGNYLPRLCGIATFTTDLVEALSAESGNSQYWAMVMNDKREGYLYPEKVRFEINQHNPTDYHQAAEFLNMNEVDLVCLQHEFGIFGGPYGGHILKLLSDLQMPVVTTFHTVLPRPVKEQSIIIARLAELSDKLVVMSRQAIDILHTVYDIPKEKITYIPHGIPDMPFVDPNYYKDHFGVLGKKVLLTFGLLSQNKGIEYVLEGLQKVVKRFPELIYIVLGATHPHVLKTEGESYRTNLQQMVRQLNLSRNVVFQNRFVTREELCEYLAAADIYITPYTGEAQITSGTLAYAMGTGKAVISTPYRYAEEMLADRRGRLVPFKNSEVMADAIIELLGDDAERHNIRKRAYDFSRDATWKEVARQYIRVFQEIRLNRRINPRPHRPSPRPNQQTPASPELPELKLDHLLALTDDTGLLQHAKYTVANRNHGYCTDDNSRGLIIAAQARHLLTNSTQPDTLCNRYLGFLYHAYDSESGRFHNFMSYDRQWSESVGSEDSHGRALWALGVGSSLLKHSPFLPMTITLFKRSLNVIRAFRSPRALAFALIGIHSYLRIFSGDSEARRICTLLTERLYRQFSANGSDSWPWLENQLNYDNAKLPHALLLAGQLMHRDDVTEMGFRSLNWLLDVQTGYGHLSPVGNHGWYSRNGEKARFDQQPIEANALVEACIAAYQVSQSKHWIDRAMRCFNWFLGHNDLNLPLYNAGTGGCRDGLQCDGVNQNEGAESTLAWLLSLATLHQLSAENSVRRTHTAKPARVAS